MFLSSVWHGVDPGYYLFFLSIPLVFVVEDLYCRVLRSRLAPPHQRIYDWVSWFAWRQWLFYLAMAFILREPYLILTYWSNIYYLGHLMIPFLYLLGLVVVRPLGNIYNAVEKNT